MKRCCGLMVFFIVLGLNACSLTHGDKFSESNDQPRRPDLEGIDDDLKLSVIDAAPAADDLVAAQVQVDGTPGKQAGIALRATLSPARSFYFGRIIGRPSGIEAEIVRIGPDGPQLLGRATAPVGALGVPLQTEMTFTATRAELKLYLGSLLVASGHDDSLTRGSTALIAGADVPVVAAVSAWTGRLPRVLVAQGYSDARLLVYETDQGDVSAVEVRGLEPARLITGRLRLKRRQDADARAALYTGTFDAATPCRFFATLRANAQTAILALVPEAPSCPAGTTETLVRTMTY